VLESTRAAPNTFALGAARATVGLCGLLCAQHEGVCQEAERQSVERQHRRRQARSRARSLPPNDIAIDRDGGDAGGQVPGLAVLIVGSRKDSQTYVNMKKKKCEELGILSFGGCAPPR